MSEEEGFIRTILAAPRDVSVMLIYADWLEDRGDSRCEYLRLLAICKGLPEDDPKAEEVGERLQELQNHLDLQWVAFMNRGRTRYQSDKEEGKSSLKRGRRRSRQEVLEADVSIFLQKYARNARRYDPGSRISLSV